MKEELRRAEDQEGVWEAVEEQEGKGRDGCENYSRKDVPTCFLVRSNAAVGREGRGGRGAGAFPCL